MHVIEIKIIDTNLDNDLLSFSVNQNNIFCIHKSYSKTIKEFIKNVFIIAINSIEVNLNDNQFDIVDIDYFNDDPIFYSGMKDKIYSINYIKKKIKIINYEISL
jgi:hypothetical protein